MNQSEKYKYIAKTDYLANLVGADVAEDILNTVIKRVEDDIDIEDRANRDLGKVDVAQADVTLPVEQQSPVGVEKSDGTQIDPATEATLTALAAALASNAGDTLQTEQQSPVGVEQVDGTQIDPATEATLSTLASVSDALASNGGDTLRVERADSAAGGFESVSDTIGTDSVFTVPPGETWYVDDLTVDGTLYVEGTLIVYGELSGSGTVTGDGTVETKV